MTSGFVLCCRISQGVYWRINGSLILLPMSYCCLSGNWYGMLENVGNDVNPWSSTANNENNAYNLNANSDGNVNPDNNNNRNNGNVVRCVAR